MQGRRNTRNHCTQGSRGPAWTQIYYAMLYVVICCAPLQVGPSHSQSIPLGTFFVLNRHRLQPNGRESHVSAWSLTCFTAFLTVLTTLEGGWFARTTFWNKVATCTSKGSTTERLPEGKQPKKRFSRVWSSCDCLFKQGGKATNTKKTKHGKKLSHQRSKAHILEAPGSSK